MRKKQTKAEQKKQLELAVGRDLGRDLREKHQTNLSRTTPAIWEPSTVHARRRGRDEMARLNAAEIELQDAANEFGLAYLRADPPERLCPPTARPALRRLMAAKEERERTIRGTEIREGGGE